MSIGAQFRLGAPSSRFHDEGESLVGRDQETVRLRSLTDPDSDAGRVLLVLGEAGVGKSALLANLVQHARQDGFRILAISGRAAEANLEFAGLNQLLRPLACWLPDLPDEQRSALQRALGQTREPACPDRLLTAGAALGLLTLASRDRPLLVVADDAHWLDRSSLDALGFIGHRLQAERVTLVVSGRGLVPPPGLGSGLPELHLDPLSASAASRLLDALPDPPRGRARSQVVTQAAGNPLALIELTRSLATDPSAGQRSAQLPLPLTDVLSAELAADFARLPKPTQAVLLVAAAADIPGSSSPSAGIPGVDAEALAPAERLGLIRVDRSGIRFSHPLLRSAIYHAAPFADRAAAHRQLAAGLEHQPDWRAWHLAAATLPPDEAIASRLESTASLAQQRGGAVGAALALERAAELSLSLEAKARRLTSAASIAVSTGQAGWVHDLASRALAITADPKLRVAASRAAGWALAWTSRPAEATSILLSVADAADEPGVAWDALATAAIVAYISGTAQARQLVRQAVDRLERQRQPRGHGGATAANSTALGACVRASTDPFACRADLVARLESLDVAAMTDPAVPGAMAWLLDEPDLCIRLLAEAARRLDPCNVAGGSAVALSTLSRTYADVGRWDEALTAATRAGELAEACQLDIVAASADLTAAAVLAMRTDTGDARSQVTTALARLGQAESGCIIARARHIAGIAAFADGSHLAAYAQLRYLFHEDGSPLHYHVSYLGIADFAAAAVRADRRLEARRIVDRALSRLDLEGNGSPRLEQLTARARGLLAEPAEAAAHFEKALSDPAGNRWPFERAQLQLDHGELLRRQRRISDARPFLAAAVETFSGLKARPWARRAEAELRACGIAIGDMPSAPEALADLTPQQREIVRLAGTGLTNREIADRMFLSPRTVSSHLHRSFPKLGVAGRHQLRMVMTPAPAVAAARG
jgi:DNA-binding CsgD family transcriptional regulator